MRHDCWQVSPETGFLINPQPIRQLSTSEGLLSTETTGRLESLAIHLPRLLETGELRTTIDALPIFDLSALDCPETDCRLTERLLLIYSYLASGYIHAGNLPAKRLPAGIAVPLVELARLVDRPPILAYATMVLGNWRRIDPAGPMSIDNLSTLYSFLDLADERWFILVHVAIEARAAEILRGIALAHRAIDQDDTQTLHQALHAIKNGLIGITKIFHRMEEGCDPDVYFQHIRPYMFGFNEIVFEGVDAFKGQPQTLRGGSGAQSAIVPALVAALGIRHQHSVLINDLQAMLSYMPAPHRRYIETIPRDRIRNYVRAHPVFADGYNHCLRQLITFRRAHFYYAKTYIFAKSTDPTGTGGTVFMDFLTRLVAETEAYLL